SYTIGWSPYYKVPNTCWFCEKDSREFAATIHFSAKIAEGVEESQLKEFARQNNVIYVGQDSYLERWHTFIVTNQSRCNTVEMANLFQESAMCEYGSPDFIGELGCVH
ncbi:MAG: hypothetical protein K2H57_10790, partial [Duncaniella sp.]|nr:hypothetical protein [Duncaniella sp.]